MSMKLMVEVFNLKVGNPGRKLVLLKLADHANDDGGCWPSYQHIADQCEMGRSTVKAHIKALEESGFIVSHERKNEKIQSSNFYTLTLDKGIEVEKPKQVRKKRKQPRSGINPGQELTESRSGSDPAPRSNSDPRISNSFEPPKEPVRAKSRPGAISFANLPEGISQELAKDFIEHRKVIKHPVSQKAFDMSMNLASTAPQFGLTAQQVIDEAILQGWRKPNPQWVANKLAKENSSYGANVSQFPQNRPRKAFPGISQAPTGTGGHR